MRRVLRKPWGSHVDSLAESRNPLNPLQFLRKDGVTYRFADFAVDPRTRRLLRNGNELHLSPKAFDLLTILIANRAQAMAKADLHEKLWPSTFVLETNLAGLVAEIRQVLEDSAEAPRFIRTVHRFGYWFTGEVTERRGEESAPPQVKYWVL